MQALKLSSSQADTVAVSGFFSGAGPHEGEQSQMAWMSDPSSRWGLTEWTVSDDSRSCINGRTKRAGDVRLALRVLLCSPWLFVFSLLVGFALISGCDRAAAVSTHSTSGQQTVLSTARLAPDKPDIVWDCGAVLAGETTRVAFPLDLLDVSSSEAIARVETSCECTQVSLRDVS